MPVQPKRDARIAVPQLRLHNCNRRAAVDEFAKKEKGTVLRIPPALNSPTRLSGALICSYVIP
jgi:hypothetical protein